MMQDEWLNLSEAAELLGIHPATLRVWADRGDLPVQRTPGGHRRFKTDDIVFRVAGRETGNQALIELLIQNMLGRARLQLVEGRLRGEHWYEQMDQQARVKLQEIGHRLLSLLQQYLLEPQAPDIMDDVHALGRAYFELGRDNGLSLEDTVRAYLLFREFLSSTVYSMSHAIGADQPAEWSRLRIQTIELTNEVLLSLVSAQDDDNVGN